MSSLATQVPARGHEPRFVAVHSDAEIRQRLRRSFDPYGPTSVWATAPRGLLIGRTAGVVIGLAANHTLEALPWLVRWRAEDPATPLLVVRPTVWSAGWAPSTALRATVTPAVGQHVLRVFLRRALARWHSPDPRVAHAVEEVAERASLSPMETRVLALASTGLRRRAFPDVIASGDATVKTLVQRMLAKTGHARLDEAALAIYRRALDHAGPASNELLAW